MKAGICPKCGSDNIDYGEHDCIGGYELQDQAIGYTMHCNKCGFQGTEYYSLTFTGFTDVDGNELT